MDPRATATVLLAFSAAFLLWSHLTAPPPPPPTLTREATFAPVRPGSLTHKARARPQASSCKGYRDLRRHLQPRKTKHQFLFTGCGYSGTGLSSHVMRALGYCVGHERMGAHGAASWIWAFPESYHGEYSDPSWYQWVVVQHRNPLKVVNSGLNTGFHPLKRGQGRHSAYFNITGPRIRARWPEMAECDSHELALLAWWETWTRQGLEIPRALVFPIGSLRYVDLLSNQMGIPLNKKDRRAVHKALSDVYNRHTNRQFNVTWETLAMASEQCAGGPALVTAAGRLAMELGY